MVLDDGSGDTRSGPSGLGGVILECLPDGETNWFDTWVWCVTRLLPLECRYTSVIYIYTSGESCGVVTVTFTTTSCVCLDGVTGEFTSRCDSADSGLAPVVRGAIRCVALDVGVEHNPSVPWLWDFHAFYGACFCHDRHGVIQAEAGILALLNIGSAVPPRVSFSTRRAARFSTFSSMRIGYQMSIPSRYRLAVRCGAVQCGFDWAAGYIRGGGTRPKE